jgi:serine/threonine-protein kinase HipA
MVVSGNGDAHLKNWGVLYPDRRRAVLGPAYDVISTVSVLPRDELALPLGGVRDFGSVRADSFDLLARRVGRDPTEIRKWATVARDRAVEGWQRESAHLPFTVAERERIEKHLRRVPFVQER